MKKKKLLKKSGKEKRRQKKALLEKRKQKRKLRIVYSVTAILLLIVIVGARLFYLELTRSKTLEIKSKIEQKKTNTLLATKIISYFRPQPYDNTLDDLYQLLQRKEALKLYDVSLATALYASFAFPRANCNAGPFRPVIPVATA